MATKPIEPGCLVLVVKGQMAGCSGTAVEFLPKGKDVFLTVHKQDFVMPEDGWIVDLPEMQRVIFPVDWIRRIDGYDQEEEVDQCKWTPMY